MTRTRLVIARAMLAGALAAFAAPLPSAAQAPPQTVTLARSGPNGFKVGEGRLHPFVDLEPRLDTAAGFFPVGSGGSLTLAPEVVMHVRPGVKFELPTPQVAVDFNGNVEYLYFTGLLSPGSSSASRLEGAANLNAAFNRQGQVGFAVRDDFSYSDKTRSPTLGVGALSLFNDVRGQLDIRPGGGALEISPSGSYSLELFRPLSLIPLPGCSDPSCDPNLVPRLSYGNVRAGLDGRWRFLPKTAVVLESSFDIRSYADETLNKPSLLLKVMGGLQGLLTTKIAVITKGGWGYDFATAAGLAAGTNANTFLAHVEGAYLLNEATTFRGGYYRSLAPTPIHQTVRDDRLYAEGRMLLSGRLVLRGYAALDFLAFGAGSTRLDIAATLDPSAEYQIMPWLYAAAGYTFTLRSSGVSTSNYTRQEAYLRVTAAY